MTDFVLRIYDYLHRHTGICMSTLCITTALLAGLVCKIDFDEDISAFLPLDEQYRESMQVYQDVSGASNLLAIFQSEDTTETDADNLVCSMNDYERFLAEKDTFSVIKETTKRFDYDKMTEMVDFVFRNIPLFLTEKDYLRFDSLFNSPSFIENQLQEDLSALMFPSSGITSEHLGKDPLNLFTPVVSEVLKNAGTTNFELYDGYIFTKDLKRGIIVQTSPYGNSETRSNAQLLQMLGAVADSVEAHNPSVTVHHTGGPAIAVGNSNQIRQDCMVSVTIAVILILALLFYAFRSTRNILLIFLSIAWGWLWYAVCLPQKCFDDCGWNKQHHRWHCRQLSPSPDSPCLAYTQYEADAKGDSLSIGYRKHNNGWCILCTDTLACHRPKRYGRVLCAPACRHNPVCYALAPPYR